MVKFTDSYGAFAKSMHYWLFLFALLGTIVAMCRWKTMDIAILVVVTTVVYTSAIYVVTQADARYSVPLRPEMYLLAMVFLQWIHTWVIHIRNRE